MNSPPTFPHPEKRTILWRYWRNPLAADGGEWVDAEDADATPYIDAYAHDDGDDGPGVGGEQGGSPPKVRTFVVTAAGVLPAKLNADAVKGMEFWIGEANFYITPEVADIGDSYPGVQAFNPLGPYMFSMSVGRAFMIGDGRGTSVRRGLERALGVEYASHRRPRSGFAGSFEDFRAEVDGSGLRWVAVETPDSGAIYATANDAAGIDALLETYREIARAVGGELHRG